MNAPAEIIERIKKLLRLARSANPHEAQLAMERAMALAEEYRISVDALNPDAAVPSIIHRDSETFARLSHDRTFASLIVKRFFRVRAITCSAIRRDRNGWPTVGQKLSFVGTSSDVEIALYVYHFLVQHFAYCWRKHRGRVRNRYSFVHGMFQGLYAKLAESEPPAENRPAKGTELALSMEAYLGEHFGTLSTKPMADPSAHAAAWAGYQQGRKTEIRNAVKGGATAPLQLT